MYGVWNSIFENCTKQNNPHQNNKRYMEIQLTYSETVLKFISGLGFK